LSGDADNIRFDPSAKEIFVGYGTGALGVINLDLKGNVGETMLDAHPESFQLEKQGPRIFINVPEAGNVTVVDRRTRTVKAKWPVTGAKLNFPMALDEANHRLFIGCRKPAKMLVLDTAVDEGASRLYERVGFKLSGIIPDYAFRPHGDLAGTMIYWERLQQDAAL
jgi:hypothetical protein